MGLSQIRAGKKGPWLVKALAAVLVVTAAASTILVQPQSPAEVHLPAVIGASALPVQGKAVMEQIRVGGPFRYEKDGTVFGNRERLLPGQKRGYYREYTVPTPGLNHRGARRIVCGGQKPRTPDDCYYTEDHYASFRLIVQ
jgi:ribonuclease T1